MGKAEASPPLEVDSFEAGRLPKRNVPVLDHFVSAFLYIYSMQDLTYTYRRSTAGRGIGQAMAAAAAFGYGCGRGFGGRGGAGNL